MFLKEWFHKKMMFQKYDEPVRANEIGAEHIDGLYSYAVILTYNHGEAENLVQETYACVMRARSHLGPDSNLKVWLLIILRNLWLDSGRHHISLGVAADYSEHLDTKYRSDAARIRMQLAIQRLPLELREVILLREFEELSYLEMAEVLNCPAGTAISLLQRARSRLGAILRNMPPCISTDLGRP
jgi:RNA polymerase sigma-70 factor, ECF subfamily